MDVFSIPPPPPTPPPLMRTVLLPDVCVRQKSSNPGCCLHVYDAVEIDYIMGV